jgi:ComF family protein
VTDLAEELIGLADFSDLIVLTKPCNSSLIIRNSFMLIPVPLHPRRKRQRGFNQAEILGEMIADKFKWQCRADILKRTKHTKPQVELTGEERQKNIKGAFEINQEISSELRLAPQVILFDDVWTTGSTLKECGRVLKKSGARQVWGITLAR